jgi:hypothetical protein
MVNQPGQIPPSPDPESSILKYIFQEGQRKVRENEATEREATLWMVVTAWMEGHIEGEDACPGCEFRGELGKGVDRGAILRQIIPTL